MDFYGCENLGWFFEAIGATKKVLFFLSKINRNFVLNNKLDKFLFDQFLTIIVERDMILRVSHWFLIRVILLNSGSEKYWAKDLKTVGFIWSKSAKFLLNLLWKRVYDMEKWTKCHLKERVFYHLLRKWRKKS